MSWTCLESDKTTKARKPHRCAVCGSRINPGEVQVTRSGVVSGEGFHRMYMHPECQAYSRDWNDDDWECHSPGVVTRAEVIESQKGADRE